MMKYRHNIPWISMIIKRQYSSKSKKNHYDYLKITSKATQGEVKSAYFKLSKLYHPDMNSSDEAKDKFRNISEAYEVLGNHEKRKQYDRHLNITSPTMTTTTTDYPIFRDLNRNLSPEELRKEAERIKAEYARHGNQNDGIPMYDMDTWTREHYGKIFQKTMAKKLRREARIREREMFTKHKNEESSSEIPALFLLIFMTIALIAFQSILSKSSNSLNPKKDVNKEKKQRSIENVKIT